MTSSILKSSQAGERPLFRGFLNSVLKNPERQALRFHGSSTTYQELFEFSAGLAMTLRKHDCPGSGLTAVLGRRSLMSYGGLLAALMRGDGYLPLNPKYPTGRLQSCMSRCGVTAVLVDEFSENCLPGLVSDEVRLWILPHRDDVSDLSEKWPEQKWLGRADLESHEHWDEPEATSEDIAYVLFTSGSTGEPKGVMVKQGNVTALIDGMLSSGWDVDSLKRFSQMPETSFDAAVMDIWTAWEVGGSLCIPTDLDLLKIDEFIIREELSYFLFVPSAASAMLRLDRLHPDRFPSLRVTVFGGEVLPQVLAEAWAGAAPNCRLENHYGPTETTVTGLHYTWRSDSSQDCHGGGVPIGWPVPGMTARVVDEHGIDVQPGESGELWLAGPQVSLGYWEDFEKTAASFTTSGDDSGTSGEIYYHTGDRVILPVLNEPFQFMGRFDDQIQIRGHRVELGEIEGVLRECTGAPVAVIGWPETAPGSADGVVAFVQSTSIDELKVMSELASRLPAFMCPRPIICMDELPTTSNGKVDRSQLKSNLSA
jgi:amino acid adenylation domain-containing protein